MSKYKQIPGKLSAEEAADALVHHATLIANGIKEGEECFFGQRCIGVNALIELLSCYVEQGNAK